MIEVFVGAGIAFGILGIFFYVHIWCFSKAKESDI